MAKQETADNSNFERMIKMTMTAKEKVEQDLQNIEVAMEQLKVDVELLGDEEKAEMKEKIRKYLGKFSDEIERIKEFDRTLTEKFGKYGKRFLYACIGILAIAGIDRLIGYIKDLF